MGNSARILILVEDRRRDGLAMMLLARTLEAIGNNSVYLSNRRTHKDLYKIVSPHVTVLPHPYALGKNVEDAEALAKKSTLILLQTEGLLHSKSDLPTVLACVHPENTNPTVKERRQYTRLFTKALMWGRYQAQICEEEGYFTKDQISVVGGVRTDLLHSEIRDPDHATKYVGFTGRFSVINMHDNRSCFNVIDGLMEKRGRKYDITREPEDFIWSVYAYARLMMIILEKSVVKKGFKAICRPHPFENFKKYKYFLKKYGENNLIIDQPQNSIGEFLSSAAIVIAPNSSVILESIISETPVITLHSIIKERLSDHVNLKQLNLPSNNWAWHPNTVEEAMELIDSAMNGVLPVMASEDGYYDYIKERFDLPREKPAILSAAEEINSVACYEAKKQDGLMRPPKYLRTKLSLHFFENYARKRAIRLLGGMGLWRDGADPVVYNASLLEPWARIEQKRLNRYWKRFAKFANIEES
ncbi:MAG: hypothetical protein K9L30_18840 [Desulfobacterales bacterium]|nr:hypothetical protein [Desulfobacterales bacterium]